MFFSFKVLLNTFVRAKKAQPCGFLIEYVDFFNHICGLF